VRDGHVITLPDAIRRLTGLPATNLGLDGRGVLRPGAFADVTVFDPQTILDRATFEQPHQFSVGVRHVLVNGVPVIRDGEHTGEKPGRALWGPGKRTVEHARDWRRAVRRGPAVEPWPRPRIVSIAPPLDADPDAAAQGDVEDVKN
jgi:N-acyl-D-aspartate/D-glutamate deacylase